MAGAHTEPVFNKLSKPQLVQIILNTEANLGSQIAKLTTEVKNLLDHSKKLEADVAIVKNINNKLVESIVATERQCWKDTQYSRRDALEVVEIMFLSRKFATWFRKLVWIFAFVTFKPVIFWRKETDQLSNYQQKRLTSNSEFLIPQRWTCLEELKLLLMRALKISDDNNLSLGNFLLQFPIVIRYVVKRES